ncbi:hypothetical protein BHUM_01192c [Candidatus Burkholderia humilis]|nr:hypothetical protein BHUM_01192c [Candidatus Burkholderia humilis]
MNLLSKQLATRTALRHTTNALLALFWFVSFTAHAQSFAANARAVQFVTDIVMNDFHTAQAGGGYVFSYDREETDATLAAKLERWLSGKAPQAIGMEPAEKQMLFGFYWAASMMPATSPCFAKMANDACQDALSQWIARELNDDPRFVRAYESARKPLGLPPLSHSTH